MAGPAKRFFYIFFYFFLCGCGLNSGVKTEYTHDNFSQKKRMSLAILPFENLTQHPRAGVIASQLFITQLYRCKQLVIQDSNKTRKLLEENGIEFSKLASNYSISKLGKILNVQAIITGSVTEYQYQHGLSENASVGYNARLVEVGSDKVLWASSYSKIGKGLFFKPSLNSTAHEVAREMVDDLVSNMNDN